MTYEKNIAVFGGTFDPPTLAHEEIIKACLHRDDLEEVWVMPSGQRTDKYGMSGDEVRLDLLTHMHKFCFGGDPRLIVSDFELQLPRPTQTYITSQALVSAYPDTRFLYVYGADSYETMDTWEDGETLKRSIGMLLIARAGYYLPNENDRLKHLTVPSASSHISSSEARNALKNGKNTTHLLSSPVHQYIEQRALYDCATIAR